jgi:hypothetical protein
MAKTIHDIETKVNNDGATPQGRLAASDFNVLVETVQRLDRKDVLVSEEEYQSLPEIDEGKIYFIYED